MSAVSRLVVGTSGSPGSLQALRYGEGLARAHHAVLIPVIAWELPGGDRAHRIGTSHELGKACREIACQQLRDALIGVWGEVPADPLVQPRVERGPAGWVLVNLACQPDDVLVVGAGRQDALARLAFSKVSRYCVARAQCPVVAVPPRPDPRAVTRPTRVGVPAPVNDPRAGPRRPGQASCLTKPGPSVR